ncbi:unnamed protein product [Spirodela intermedia]|uniref:poly(A)-specific ribonuclease n=1 Tax=Spirodela intermedia TaxID=51605 RepID=A0A7I8JP43_SPIIN|nr:unnamed protein product [Spirodela intermedia]CAA6671944.1 unnamed protein product [Spirodela intermedia]
MDAGGGHSGSGGDGAGGGEGGVGVNMGMELPGILEALDSATFVAMDTEFPGSSTRPRFASSSERYRDVRRNVDNMKLIQLGLCFFGDGGRRRTWQISFRDFDVASASDARSEASVELLKRSGIDLCRTRREGVDSELFSEILWRCDWVGRRKPRWVTFQGLYDIAYLVKLLTGGPLPPTLREIIDVKYLAKFCGGFHLGLGRLAETVGVKPEGGAAHQAGVDALMTAAVFEVQMEQLSGSEEELEGILHGIEEERILPSAGRKHSSSSSSRREEEEEEERGGGALPDMCSPPPSTLFLTPAVVYPRC